MKNDTGRLKEIEKLIERLDTAYQHGGLSVADRIIEFPGVLDKLKWLFTTEIIEEQHRNLRVYAMLDKLLNTGKFYKENLSDPNAKTRWRSTRPREFDETMAAISAELHDKKEADDERGGTIG